MTIPIGFTGANTKDWLEKVRLEVGIEFTNRWFWRSLGVCRADTEVT